MHAGHGLIIELLLQPSVYGGYRAIPSSSDTVTYMVRGNFVPYFLQLTMARTWYFVIILINSYQNEKRTCVRIIAHICEKVKIFAERACSFFVSLIVLKAQKKDPAQVFLSASAASVFASPGRFFVYFTYQRWPQFWQTATDLVFDTTLVFLLKSTTSSFQIPNTSHAMISHHQPMKSQYKRPFFRFSLTSVTAWILMFSLPHFGHFILRIILPTKLWC